MTATSRAGRAPRGRLMEILAVVLLGLATVGTAWCGYQAARWNGEQGDLAQESTDLRVESSRLFGLATQAVAFDANVVAQYAQAVVDGNAGLQEFYRETLFRADFLPVLDRWEAAIDAGGGAPPRLLEDEDYLQQALAPYEEAVANAERRRRGEHRGGRERRRLRAGHVVAGHGALLRRRHHVLPGSRRPPAPPGHVGDDHRLLGSTPRGAAGRLTRQECVKGRISW